MNQDSSKQSQISRASNEEDFSLLDMIIFFRKAWKTIAIFGFFGAIVAVAYIFLVPNLYQATAQLKMAQISLTNPANPFGVSVEDPASLIARMQMPTNYDSAMIAACDYQGVTEAALQLSKEVKISAPKGLTNTVEIKVLGKSPEIARSCTQALIDKIALLQMQFAKPFVEEAKIKLAQDNDRIEAARKLIAKADQGGGAMSAAYLAARDEITYFLTDREKMLDLINSAQQRGTKLISPIYVSERPVSPKKVTSLLAGLFIGLFVGLVIALGRQFLASINRTSKFGGDNA